MIKTDYRACIQACDHYIESHPGERISAADLAEVNGYSLSHFSLVFHAFTGIPLSEYVRNTRLRKAAAAIAAGATVTQAALDAGFDTNAGFNKAFRRLYGISPQAYCRRIRDGREELLPVPQMVRIEKIPVLGYQIRGKTFPSLEAAWQHVDFSGFPEYPENISYDGELGIWTDPDALTGEMTYFFGMMFESEKILTVPEGFSFFLISGGDYAVFVASETAWTDDPAVTAEKTAGTWKTIFSRWFPEQAEQTELVSYDESRQPFELYKGSRALIYVPVI